VASVVALTATPRQSSRPTRVISLVPAVTEMLFAVGAGAQVAGMSSFDTYPPEARKKPQVGALLNPDFERILSLKPDLVVVYGSQTELLGRLERMSIPTFVYRHAGLADVSTTISSLGARVGRSAEAAKVVRGLQTTLTAIRTSVAGRPRPRVALVFGREAGALRNIFVSGGIGFLHDLIETAGGLNAFADVRRESVQVSSEAMLTHAPDIIIETHQSSWDTSLTPREQAVWRALASVPAVRTNRIHIVADDRLFIPGPRVAEAARVLAGVVHPEIRIPQGTP
jgi:iron complex transport system substrate-binding protein